MIKRNNINDLNGYFNSWIVDPRQAYDDDWFKSVTGGATTITRMLEKNLLTHGKFTLELAGIKAEEIEITLDSERSLLTVSAEAKSGRITKSIRHTYTLAPSVDLEKISSTYEDGLLVIDLPQKAKEEPKLKKIEILAVPTKK